ncbi:TPA: hypothetical protein LWI60_002768 [Listeria innocua]|uniref:hypothetical protein n=1 Tax=Listeria innocua TaxID=1642 RepID=UPI0010E6DBAF|nr:hypothetical protein [Listeria innocua]QPQ95055.1 hypothetical protein I6H04_08030 [Listeria welshimeri]ECX4531687.1 hypothetical protein [Listeria innocua]ECX5126277.1 hypothetical protein [Listeria innocua]EDO1167668.1 hypothetical protein [Listeria innocua]EDO1168584.1 hypothetical protein [Listeria innocua]
MIIKEKFYPYPVLTYFSNDIIGEFSIEDINVFINTDKSKYVISGIVRLLNPTIEELIDSNSVEIISHVECRKTRYRQTFKICNNSAINCEISSNFLEGNVDIQIIAVSKKRIENYKNSECHPDFKELTFPIEVGQILAVCKPYKFYAQREPSKVKDLPSIFSIIKNVNDVTKSVDYKLNNERIIVMLSKENYFRYKTVMNNSYAQALLSSMMLVPVLAIILQSFSNENGIAEHEGTEWLDSIRKRINECNLVFDDIDWEQDSLAIANELIGDPLSYGLKMLEEGGD